MVVARAKAESQVAELPNLILDGIPEFLRADVIKELKNEPDPQCFADLLAARMERDAQLPETHRIGAPILWLRQMVDASDLVDFTPAFAFAARRDAAESERRRAEEKREQDAIQERERAAMQAQELTAASARVLAMPEGERQALALQASRGHRIPRAAEEIERSVLAGRLPEHPLARAMVLNALRSPQFSPPSGGPAE